MATTDRPVRFRCEGRVRGSCGTMHRSLEAARACIARDLRDVQREHGPTAYTDRRVIAYTADVDDDGDPIRPYEWTRSELHTQSAR